MCQNSNDGQINPLFSFRVCGVQITFHNEVNSLAGERTAVDIVYPDFSKAFYIVSCNIPIGKLMKHRLDEQTVKWNETDRNQPQITVIRIPYEACNF